MTYSLKNAIEEWQINAYRDGQAGSSGKKDWLVRSDYRYNSPFNSELIKWYNAGWDSI